jgi:NADH-quinone oxidoreductase subunit M
MNTLDLLLFLPLVAFLLILLVGRASDALARTIALGASLVAFGLTVMLIPAVLQQPDSFSHVSRAPWIAFPPIYYHVGIDSISLWLVFLVTLLFPLVVLLSWNRIQRRVPLYFALLMLSEFSLIGVFVSLDLFLYYVMWELTLIPMLFLLGIWGGEDRSPITLKFFLYTFFGSVLLLAATLGLYALGGSFDYPKLISDLAGGRLRIDARAQHWLFLGFFAAFAVKTPLWPLHTWQPGAYSVAPTPVTIILSAIMAKMGVYSMLRFCLPLFPLAARENAYWIALLAITGIIYGALVAIIQPNAKRLIAWSSLSHMGFIVLGIFTLHQNGIDGAIYQMVCHGISTGALFAMLAMLEDRRGSLDIAAFGGAAGRIPVLASLFLVASFASIGLPLLNNFVGEFLILQGAAHVSLAWAAAAGFGVIFSAVYMLWMYQRMFLGQPAFDVEALPDLNRREYLVLVPLVVLMFYMGVASNNFLPGIGQSTRKLIQQTKVNVEYRVGLDHAGGAVYGH